MTRLSVLPAGARGWLRELPPLSDRERELEGRLRVHVQALAGGIGERNVFRPDRLHAAAAYLEATLVDLGHRVDSQPFESLEVPVRNLEVEHPGRSASDGILVVGAHYDSVLGCPGANDNGTGVASLIELSRLLARRDLPRTVRFVLFVNEEPPFFTTGHMGSLRYARRCRERGERVAAMFSLETMGCFSDEEGSQQYPFPFRFFYPSRGNFIGFVGNLASRHLVRRVVGSFRRNASIPAEWVAVPGWITGIGWSDHWAFWQQGYPAAMVTDTALFRYEHYHSPLDTPDRIRYGHLARVVAGLERVIVDLAND